MSGMAISCGPATPEDFWRQQGRAWARAEAFDLKGCDVWTAEFAARAYSVGARAAEKMASEQITALAGERATLADWIAEALSVLEADDDRNRLLIEQGNALVVAVRGGER